MNKIKVWFSGLKEKKNREALKIKIKKILFGMSFSDGLIFKVLIYTLLISFAYVYLYPMLFMLVNSLKNVDDLIDPGVRWIPTTLQFSNYTRAWKVLKMPTTVFTSGWYVMKVSLVATVTSAVVGYGFATFKFPLKMVLFTLMLTNFILPPQVLMVSNMLIYNRLGIMSSEMAMVLPALLGQGLNQSIFILLFYQFFKQIPQVLRESAEIDGASQFKIFYKIALPSAIPSIIIVFIFAFVWYWNETFVTSLYVGGQVTMPLLIQGFVNSYIQLYPPGTPGGELNEAIKLAANMVSILPLIILYFMMQKHFVESIDRTGIAGE